MLPVLDDVGRNEKRAKRVTIYSVRYLLREKEIRRKERREGDDRTKWINRELEEMTIYYNDEERRSTTKGKRGKKNVVTGYQKIERE